MKYLALATERVEKRIADDLPSKFAIILDGWSDSATSTHFVGFYAHYQKLGTKEAHRALLAFSPLIDETDFSAQSHVDFIIATLNVLGMAENDLQFLVGDNCSTNLRIAEILNLPIIGCGSHRFNLAVHKILESNEFLLKRVNELMKRLFN